MWVVSIGAKRSTSKGHPAKRALSMISCFQVLVLSLGQWEIKHNKMFVFTKYYVKGCTKTKLYICKRVY